MLRLTLFVAALLPFNLAGQFEQPDEAVRKLADEIAKEMAEIDRMLLESSSGQAGQATDAMRRNVGRIDQLLRQTTKSQGSAVRKIDSLIAELEKMQGSGSCPNGGGEKPSSRSQSPPEQGQQRQGQRQDAATPDLVQQNQPRNKPDGEQPQDQNAQEQSGVNRPAGAEPQDATERNQRPEDQARWGDLPEYLEGVKGRGAQPTVPEKYRRYYEALLKQNREVRKQ